jgi:hypothetical protein
VVKIFTVGFVMVWFKVLGMISRVLSNDVWVAVVEAGTELVGLLFSTLPSESESSSLITPLLYILNRLLTSFLVALAEGTTVCGFTDFGLTGRGLTVVLSELVFIGLPVLEFKLCVFNLALVVLVRSMIAFKLGLTESGALSKAFSNIVSVLAALALTDNFALFTAAIERADCCPDLEAD